MSQTSNQVVQSIHDAINAMNLKHSIANDGKFCAPKRYCDVFVNFYNIWNTTKTDGAFCENNRILFKIGFPPVDAETPVDRVKVETLTNSYSREVGKMRAKTGTPEQIVEYLMKYINQVTHTIQPRQ
jgi:hypothetical protein